MKQIIRLVVFVVTLAGCGKNNDLVKVIEQAEQNTIVVTDAQYKAAAIEVGQIQNMPLSRKLQVNGMLDVPPQNLVTISAPMGGFVKWTKLLQGMKVKKGAVLVTLENQEYIQLQQDYLDNRSKLEFLQNEYERQQALSKENINSEKVLQQAKSQYESSRAIVKGLEAKLLMLNIRPTSLQNGEIKPVIYLYSPIDGFVTQVNVNIGQFVNGTDVMFKIVNLEHIHVELQVYEKDIRELKVGQNLTFTLINDQEPKTASVYLIGKEISPERTVRVHCHLDTEDPSLLPGMFVTATIEAKTGNANVVPVDAIVNIGGQNMIFVPSGKHQFKAVRVETGGQTDSHIEILPIERNLQVGESIVVKGAFELLGLLKNEQE
ncbi:MAG: efflux RND transporter periplasmic adaptor subunit [Cyclobacteriaceae bacterium]